MWFDGERQPNTLYVANTSRGKDSTAMLRAIQLMGWPLDMIVSVDIWFDETTPAELPPMVKFKNEYDQKVLDVFGVPVTRLCAQKRSQNVQVEREREREPETDGEDHTSRSVDCSTQRCIPRSTDGTLMDSQKTTTHGASCSRISPMEGMSSKLTYVDIFYRRLTPKRERERERESCNAAGIRTAVSESTDSRCKKEHGATRYSKSRHYGIPESEVPLVYGRTQEGRINGFPISINRGNWCTRLKTEPLFNCAPE